MATYNNKSTGIDAVSFFGKGMHVKGKVYSEADIRVDGTITGKIECQGKVIMGDESQLEVSKLKTDTININGQLVGDLIALKSIVIGAKGNIKGNISTPILQVDKGAVINGVIKMEQ